MMKKPPVSSLSDGILKLFHTLPDQKKLDRIKLNIIWKKIVGPILAEHTNVSVMTGDGVLIVDVDDIAWKKPLDHAERFLLEKLNKNKHIYRQIHSIRFRFKNWSSFPAPHSTGIERRIRIKKSDDLQIKNEFDEDMVKLARKIEDPTLRNAFLKAFLARRRDEENDRSE